MRNLDGRLLALERSRIGHRGPSAVAQLLDAARAGEVADILHTVADGLLEDVIRFSLGLPPDTELTDELLTRLAMGGAPGGT